VRRHAAVLLGILTFCAALAGFLYLGVSAQAGQVRVLVTSRSIPAGQVLQATTVDLSPGGELVHLSSPRSETRFLNRTSERSKER
jgi:hypothetical protein